MKWNESVGEQKKLVATSNILSNWRRKTVAIQKKREKTTKKWSVL